MLKICAFSNHGKQLNVYIKNEENHNDADFWALNGFCLG